MIKTKKITSLNSKLPPENENDIYVNVFSWHPKSHPTGSEYNTLRSKYFDWEIYAHHALKNKRLNLRLEYKTDKGYEFHLQNNQITQNYYKWWLTIFDCKKPIPYPNGYSQTKETAFSLLINANGEV